MLIRLYLKHPRKACVHPFPDDPDIGKLVITTEPLSHSQYVAMCQRFDATVGLRRGIASIKDVEYLTWPSRPCQITAITPRIVRLLHRTLRISRDFPISVSMFEYVPPTDCFEHMSENIAMFLRMPNLPSFLREVRDELEQSHNEDPYKIGEKLLTAGLDERFITDQLQSIF